MGFCSVIASLVLAAGWVHLGPADRVGGRMVSGGYLRGKTVLVDCRDYGAAESADVIRQLEDTWRAFKSKPFVVLGAHRGGDANAAVKRLGVTYPVYSGAAPDGRELESGRLYVFDVTGKFLYICKDARQASGVAASAIVAAANPQTPKQWAHILDYELEFLPGKALADLREYRARNPADAARYDRDWARLSQDQDAIRLERLERMAKAARDGVPRAFGAADLARAEKAYGALRGSADGAVAQEAKNCLADLKWAAAAGGAALSGKGEIR